MPEGKETIQRPTHRWEIVIKMDLTETQWEDTYWIHLYHDRNYQQALMLIATISFPHRAWNFLIICEIFISQGLTYTEMTNYYRLTGNGI